MNPTIGQLQNAFIAVEQMWENQPRAEDLPAECFEDRQDMRGMMRRTLKRIHEAMEEMGGEPDRGGYKLVRVR